MLINIVPLATDRGFTLVEASMVAAIMSICSFAGKVAGGWLSDRLGRKNVWTAALLFQTLIVIMLYFSQQVWVLFLFAVLFGLSMGGWTGIIGAFPADYFGMRSTGAILGFALVVGSIGISTGPLVGSYFYDTMNSYDNMILICIFTSLVAVFLSLLMKPVYK